ncbi:uncharacterized protein [Chelonus insularis]|uniref:uncharacterized protein n=1 Tax=Chelonus insularis TaxID=460826 RepID=UPI00158D3B5C|nr:uncharacterized protein LOC118073071 [Chelonus insularis]
MHESSDESSDEEEVTKNFDAETQLIVQNDTLPKKSADKYMLVYNNYMNWKQENKDSLSGSEENNLIVYFKSLSSKLCPATLWSIHSMLKSTLNANNNIDISKFYKLKGLIKNNAKGHKSKKSAVLTWDQAISFINNAPDNTHLAHKVVLIFGICGATRCEELKELGVSDVEDINGNYLVSINDSKNGLPRKFLVGPPFYEQVKSYISFRPEDFDSGRFFVQFLKGKCTRQPIGKNKIGQIPRIIAEFLKLAYPERYTGHCLRRTSATLLSNSGASITMLKQLGGWKSANIAEGYIENSLLNRQKIFNKITHAAQVVPPSDENLQQFTSKTNPANSETLIQNDQSVSTETNDEDCFEDIVLDDATLTAIDNSFISENPVSSPPSFTTANNEKIIINSDPRTDRPCHFLKKPPISVFSNGKENQPPEKKIKLQQLHNANSDVKSTSAFNNLIVNKRKLESKTSENKVEQETSETKSRNFDEPASALTETFSSKTPNVMYESCVFHGNIINNFYSSNKQNPEPNE